MAARPGDLRWQTQSLRRANLYRWQAAAVEGPVRSARVADEYEVAVPNRSWRGIAVSGLDRRCARLQSRLDAGGGGGDAAAGAGESDRGDSVERAERGSGEQAPVLFPRPVRAQGGSRR